MIKRIEKTKIMHRVVTHNGIAFLGGIIADDVSVGMGGQVTQICAKLDQVLALAGTDKTKLLSAQLFITDMSLKNEMNESWLAWLNGDDLPARATIGVADLGAPEIKIEVVVTAAV
ncbi:RidA family protein [Azospirillum agricola]|uniref:RidA family protein n=1 Tax=Azospirillum agricola TaxID=1720247 RepID=UPI000A0F34CD|nr:RidA family protein [Azospirillum agricola]SMH63028.1 Enamine deaminase RidA, house cleaning of reactive enamine intermediates, YjgF/YER057c/UK114 family [Azospirillum lipoferum]